MTLGELKSTLVTTLNNRDKGFTIIEVLIAMAIFAVSVTALTGSFQGNINNATHLKNKTLATWIAQNKLVEMKYADAPPTTAKKSEKVQFASRSWIVETWGKKTAQGRLINVIIDVKEDTDDADAGVLATLETFSVAQ